MSNSEPNNILQYDGERTVHIYTLSHSGTPKYQGEFDYRSFVMRIPNAIIIPYSPIDHPFPFLDVIITDFNSFLILGEKTTKDNKNFTKEIHHIIWKQVNYYKFVPYLFNFPLKFTKSHLLKLMLIQPKDGNNYELWKIRDHQLYKKINEGSPDDQANNGTIEYDSIVMMKIIPYETFKVKFHVRFSFFYIGENSRFIGTPLIIGIENPDCIRDLLNNFPNFAPKWVHNCEMRFLMKNSTKNSNNSNSSKNFAYNDYIFTDHEEPYFNVICQLIDIDYYMKAKPSKKE